MPNEVWPALTEEGGEKKYLKKAAKVTKQWNSLVALLLETYYLKPT